MKPLKHTKSLDEPLFTDPLHVTSDAFTLIKPWVVPSEVDFFVSQEPPQETFEFFRRLLEESDISISLTTKSHHIADPEFLALLEQYPCRLNITICCNTPDPDQEAFAYSCFSSPSLRKAAIETLLRNGVPVSGYFGPINPAKNSSEDLTDLLQFYNASQMWSITIDPCTQSDLVKLIDSTKMSPEDRENLYQAYRNLIEDESCWADSVMDFLFNFEAANKKLKLNPLMNSVVICKAIDLASKQEG